MPMSFDFRFDLRMEFSVDRAHYQPNVLNLYFRVFNFAWEEDEE